MMKFKIQWDVQKDSYTLYIKFTDGIEPVLMTDDFNAVIDKMEAIQKALPQIEWADKVDMFNPKGCEKY